MYGRYKRHNNNNPTIVSTTVTTSKHTQLPDWQQDHWTEPNDNPVKWVYKYRAKSSLPKWVTEDADIWLWTTYKYWICGIVLAIIGGIVGLIGAIGWLIPGASDFVYNIWDNAIAKDKAITSAALQFFFNESLQAAGATKIAFWTSVAAAAAITIMKDTGFKQYGAQFQNKIKEAKQRCDNSYDPETGRYRIPSATITLTATYDKDITQMSTQISKMRGKGFRDMCVRQDPTEVGVDNLWFEGLTNVNITIDYD